MTAPLPIFPGDEIYAVLDDDGTTVHGLCAYVGVDIEGHLYVFYADAFRELGAQEQLFLSQADADLFTEGKLPEDYATVDISRLRWKIKPGTTVYIGVDNIFTIDIVEEEVQRLMYDGTGRVVITTASGDYFWGLDPVFLSPEKAMRWLRNVPEDWRGRCLLHILAATTLWRGAHRPGRR